MRLNVLITKQTKRTRDKCNIREELAAVQRTSCCQQTTPVCLANTTLSWCKCMCVWPWESNDHSHQSSSTCEYSQEVQRQDRRLSEVMDALHVERLLLLCSAFQRRINATGLNIQLCSIVKTINSSGQSKRSPSQLSTSLNSLTHSVQVLRPTWHTFYCKTDAAEF